MMKSSIRYFLPLLLAALLLSSCHQHGRIIPRGELAEVYAELFLADQWIYDHDVKYMTDTVAVYEPILEKHGYTVEDFRASIDEYLNDADEFMEVMDRTKYILQCRLKDIDERRMTASRLDSIRRARESRAIELTLLGKEGVERDSLVRKLFPMLPVDSLPLASREQKYDGPFKMKTLTVDMKDTSSMKREKLGNLLVNRADLKDLK